MAELCRFKLVMVGVTVVVGGTVPVQAGVVGGAVWCRCELVLLVGGGGNGVGGGWGVLRLRVAWLGGFGCIRRGDWLMGLGVRGEGGRGRCGRDLLSCITG